MELQHLIDLIKELTPDTKCKYVRSEDYCTFVGIEEDEPRVNGLTPTGEKHSVSGSYLTKLAESIKEYVPFNISQLMNNSGSNRPVIESIIAHTSEFYWIQSDRARYVVWIPTERHNPNLLLEWKDAESLKSMELAHAALDSKRRKDDKDTTFAQKLELLLKAKKNLVLTGAPGTGKTYIAKQVAASIVSGSSKEWKDLDDTHREQVGFVQFHPSFDYTDFVEGLRPDKDGNFSRQDGIFKEFCKKALKNLEDSQKTLSQISSERRFEDLYQQFISDIEDKPIDEIPLRTGGKMKIIRITENNNLKLGTTGTSDELYTVSLNRLRKLAEVYPDKASLESIKNISKEIRAAINGCHASAYYATLHFIYDNYKTSEIEITTPVEKKDFVFIIDEINRGELSKIFGELFYSIEPDYRGIEGRVKTQYINMVDDDDEFKEGFYIPENVYIIGTMNDVDRGVEAMDFAIRRRFAWKEVTAEESAANMGITGTALAKMNKINEVIKEKLGQAYCIGGAYFRKLDGDNFADLWDNHLSGIVTEYFRGEPEADARIAEIKAVYDAAEEKKEESNLAPAPAEAETTPAAE
jgi:hypothetical protein